MQQTKSLNLNQLFFFVVLDTLHLFHAKNVQQKRNATDHRMIIVFGVNIKTFVVEEFVRR